MTDPTVKHKVVIADAAHKTKTLFAFGEDRNREPTSRASCCYLPRDVASGPFYQF
jgi:hypothetical protein